jgi:hypothetical protein
MPLNTNVMYIHVYFMYYGNAVHIMYWLLVLYKCLMSVGDHDGDPWKPPKHRQTSEWRERVGRSEEPGGVLFKIADCNCGLQKH